MPDVTRTSLAYLDELEDNDRIILMPTAQPDVVSLAVEWVNEDGTVVNSAHAYLTVFDAMKLREGLDTFISLAVGADV